MGLICVPEDLAQYKIHMIQVSSFPTGKIQSECGEGTRSMFSEITTLQTLEGVFI